eukprot:CAMPEP_0119130634 /NCGR_PEP_ID=MMETSP1310-20130426/8224_1 /TAXON_ID=464262 /ORGANISM="Genus nov. species nov., Strain RCC2339" /LENGTH=266 /DNA_ID=CAMNT_0007121159 /DNA_START=75 /DNA_END=872 /DNA_ORIENTATION=-
MSCGKAVGALLVVLTVVVVTEGKWTEKVDPSCVFSCDAFKKSVSEGISNGAESISYDDLWDAFHFTDTHWVTSCDGNISDVFTNKCWGFDEQCGNYQEEFDCFNREHTWPKSWWGGDSGPDTAYTDLHHIYPGDGYDNSIRGNYPYCDVIPGTETRFTDNGGVLGETDTGSGRITCFEPADFWKGILARGYFYISVRYMDLFTCCEEPGVDNAAIDPWLEETLRQWHADFPPTDEEKYRNQVIHDQYQNNKNPFIDHPEWVDLICD